MSVQHYLEMSKLQRSGLLTEPDNTDYHTKSIRKTSTEEFRLYYCVAGNCYHNWSLVLERVKLQRTQEVGTCATSLNCSRSRIAVGSVMKCRFSNHAFKHLSPGTLFTIMTNSYIWTISIFTYEHNTINTNQGCRRLFETSNLGSRTNSHWYSWA